LGRGWKFAEQWPRLKSSTAFPSAIESSRDSKSMTSPETPRNPLWLGLWLLTVGIGVFGFLQLGLSAASH
jgi:hypothetical protein